MVVAYDDGALVGFASYSFLWPAVGLTASLFLKQLYGLLAARGPGGGKAIMQEPRQADEACSRVG